MYNAAHAGVRGVSVGAVAPNEAEFREYMLIIQIRREVQMQ